MGETNPNQEVPSANRELNFGEKAVGLTFNPSFDPRVDEVKKGFAKIIDSIADLPADSYLSLTFKNVAIQTCVMAQMAVVKFITWKD